MKALEGASKFATPVSLLGIGAKLLKKDKDDKKAETEPGKFTDEQLDAENRRRKRREDRPATVMTSEDRSML